MSPRHKGRISLGEIDLNVELIDVRDTEDAQGRLSDINDDIDEDDAILDHNFSLNSQPIDAPLTNLNFLLDLNNEPVLEDDSDMGMFFFLLD